MPIWEVFANFIKVLLKMIITLLVVFTAAFFFCYFKYLTNFGLEKVVKERNVNKNIHVIEGQLPCFRVMFNVTYCLSNRQISMEAHTY